jgi:hypothetical protein
MSAIVMRARPASCSRWATATVTSLQARAPLSVSSANRCFGHINQGVYQMGDV